MLEGGFSRIFKFQKRRKKQYFNFLEQKEIRDISTVFFRLFCEMKKSRNQYTQDVLHVMLIIYDKIIM